MQETLFTLPPSAVKTAKSTKKKNDFTKKVVKTLDHNKLRQFIILKYVKRESINWPRDMKACEKLLAQFPEPQFWYSIENKDFKGKELQFDAIPALLTGNSLNYLFKKYAAFKLVLSDKPTYNIEVEKFGEDIKITEKPKSLMEFLK